MSGTESPFWVSGSLNFGRRDSSRKCGVLSLKPSGFIYLLELHPAIFDLGVAGGATRAALTLHMAKSGNAADIAAKEGSQVKLHMFSHVAAHDVG